MGSKSDAEFAEKIRSTLVSYSVMCDVRIASAHRTTEYLLGMLKEYSLLEDEIVAITVAGLSDALSGVVAAQRLFPVVACPPDTEKLGFPKVFSSAFTPPDVPVAFVSDPVKAANFVVQIFALSNKSLSELVEKRLKEKQNLIISEDKDFAQRKSQ